MSEGRKSNLIPSVKSGKGIKILAELEARVKWNGDYYSSRFDIDIDYQNQVQADYISQKYAHKYACESYVETKTDNTLSGEIVVTDDLVFNYLISSFINDEKMIVFAGKEKFTKKYYQDDWERLRSYFWTTKNIEDNTRVEK